MDESRRCTATAKATGERCRRAAHPGASVCVKHGGGAPQVRLAAARRLSEERAERMLVTYGSPIEVDPLSALLGELYRTAGHVEWLGLVIADLERGDVTQEQTERGMVWERPAVWIDLYQHERTHLAKVAKDCLSVGIEERRVKLVEEQGRMVADVIRRIVAALGLDPAAPEVREVVRRELTAVSSAA